MYSSHIFMQYMAKLAHGYTMPEMQLASIASRGRIQKKGISADTKSPPFFLFCSSLVESRRDLGSQPIKGSSAMHLQGSVNYKAVTSTSAVSNRMIE